MAYLDAFRAHTDLIAQLGEGNAHLVWVLGLLLQESDLEALASTCLTDGSDDKKIDFIYLDREEGRIVFAQGFYGIKAKDAAPANKASDLNTAAAWLFSGDVSKVPEELRNAVLECRKALEESEITNIDVLYVHNLPESLNVARELETVLNHIKTALGPSSVIAANAREIGGPQIEHLFASMESHIQVRDDVPLPSALAFVEEGPEWVAGVTSVPGMWLHELYKRFGEALFSANYRGFLGFNRRKKINIAIRSTAETRSDDFFVFNNGVTLLTLKINEDKNGPRLAGVSIINGAQTTGAIGNVDEKKHNLAPLRVLCKVIQCTSSEKIDNIVRFNNTQNEITSWDQYSGDPDQQRIEGEFAELGYQYQRKRGSRATTASITIEDVAQPLAAFMGRYSDANRGKNRIFDRGTNYREAFAGKKARHILLVYVLARAIDAVRTELKLKHSKGELIDVEKNQLALLRNLRFKYYFLTLIAKCLEPIIGQRVDCSQVAFRPEAAHSNNTSVHTLVARSMPVVSTLLSFIGTSVSPDNLSECMSGEGQKTDSIVKTISGIMHGMKVGQQFGDWAGMISPS